MTYAKKNLLERYKFWLLDSGGKISKVIELTGIDRKALYNYIRHDNYALYPEHAERLHKFLYERGY